ncbi:MAG: metallophosphoesterase [Deltaproteobacteria bacterium]|nr:metallophosphoesterase [Deltaproteobacteria bacterium]
MKILHCADLHFANDEAVLTDIVKCCGYLLNTAEKERPDIAVLAGDLFDEKVSLDSPAVKSAVDFVVNLGSLAPVLLIRGTNSHDHDSLHIFKNIDTAYPIYVADSIEQVAWTSGGFKPFIPGVVGAVDGKDIIALISCLPSVSKAHILAGMSLDIESSNLHATDLLRDVFQAWGAVNREMRAKGIPTIVAGHGSLTGSELSTGQQLVGKDLEFGISDLTMADADIVCLGHIHKAQRFKNIYYAGSITRLNFGETEEKGFWLHVIGSEVRSRFITTPARKMVTLDITSPDDLNSIDKEVLKDSLVRVRYEVNEDDLHKVNDEAIKTALEKEGAVSVKIEKTVVAKQRVRAEGISKMRGLEDKVRKWAETVGETLPEGVLIKALLLDKEPEEIISAINDSNSFDAEKVEAAGNINNREEGQTCDLFAQN